MNVTQLERKLIAAARANPPTDRVPYAFEKRIIAHLAAQPVVDAWALWLKRPRIRRYRFASQCFGFNLACDKRAGCAGGGFARKRDGDRGGNRPGSRCGRLARQRFGFGLADRKTTRLNSSHL